MDVMSCCGGGHTHFGRMDMTENETALMKMSLRYEYICAFLGWNSEFRQIGRLLLVTAEPVKRSEMPKATGISRTTIFRRLADMGNLGLLVETDAGIMHSRVGRAFHLSTHREVLAVATGKIDHFSPQMLAALGTLEGRTFDVDELGKLTFPDKIAGNFNKLPED